MPSKERLALEGAIVRLKYKIATLRLKIKGAAALIRNDLAVYKMMHLEQIDAEQLRANYEIIATSLAELRPLEAELEELKAEAEP